MHLLRSRIGVLRQVWVLQFRRFAGFFLLRGLVEGARVRRILKFIGILLVFREVLLDKSRLLIIRLVRFVGELRLAGLNRRCNFCADIARLGLQI